MPSKNPMFTGVMEFCSVAAIRKRPGMYLGGTSTSLFLDYIVSAMKEDGASSYTIVKMGFEYLISHNGVENRPVDHWKAFKFGESPWPVVTALSSSFTVKVVEGECTWALIMRRGEIERYYHPDPEPGGDSRTFIRLTPDPEIFGVDP